MDWIKNLRTHALTCQFNWLKRGWNQRENERVDLWCWRTNWNKLTCTGRTILPAVFKYNVSPFRPFFGRFYYWGGSRSSSALIEKRILFFLHYSSSDSFFFFLFLFLCPLFSFSNDPIDYPGHQQTGIDWWNGSDPAARRAPPSFTYSVLLDLGSAPRLLLDYSRLYFDIFLETFDFSSKSRR